MIEVLESECGALESPGTPQRRLGGVGAGGGGSLSVVAFTGGLTLAALILGEDKGGNATLDVFYFPKWFIALAPLAAPLCVFTCDVLTLSQLLCPVLTLSFSPGLLPFAATSSPGHFMIHCLSLLLFLLYFSS